MENINILGALIASISSFVISMIYYSPKVMGAYWIEAVGLKKEKVEGQKIGMKTTLITTFILNFLIFSFLSFLFYQLRVHTIVEAIYYTLIVLFFIHAVAFINSLFETKNLKLFHINILHDIITFFIGAIILITV